MINGTSILVFRKKQSDSVSNVKNTAAQIAMPLDSININAQFDQTGLFYLTHLRL
jgi:hypothetical protein